MVKNRAIEINRGWQPIDIYYVPNRTAWNHLMRTEGIEDEPYPFLDITHTDAQCHMYDRADRSHMIVIALSDSIVERREYWYMSSIIVHECVHAWQFIRKTIGERKPGLEQEAYAIQYLTLHITEAFLSTQGKGIRWKL